MLVELYYHLFEALVVRAMELHLEFSYPRETKGGSSLALLLLESLTHCFLVFSDSNGHVNLR